MKNKILKKWKRRRLAALLLSTVFAFTEGATCLVYAADDNAAVIKEANYIINKFQMAEDIAYQKLKEGSPESAVNFPQSLTAEVLIEQETEIVTSDAPAIVVPAQEEKVQETETAVGAVEEKSTERFTAQPLMQQIQIQPEAQNGVQAQNNAHAETQPATQASREAQSRAQIQNNTHTATQPATQVSPEAQSSAHAETQPATQASREVQSSVQVQTQPATTVAKETQKKTETKVITQTQEVPVTWKLRGDTAFDSTAERTQDTYIYTAVIPESYSVAEGVSIPVITVEIIKKQVAFSQSVTLDGITVSVVAGEGVFPEDAVLSVKKLSEESSEEKIVSAIENSLTEKEQYVVVETTCSFDISITDRKGNELQPDTSKGEVTISFQNVETLKEAGKDKSVEVFHVDDTLRKAEPVTSKVKESGQTVEIEAEHFSIYTVALTRAAVTVFENDGYPYGMNMSSNSVTLVTEIAEDYSEDVKSVQWYYSPEKDGNYTAISRATSLSYTFTPQVGNKYWYKCKVNNIETKSVQLLKASASGGADIKPLRADTQWYVSNGTMAYTIWSGNTYFDVIGKYIKDDKEYWINTSYGRKWKTKTQNVDALRFSFDENKPHLIGMEVKLASDETTYGFDADVMLADYSITSYSDSASLKAIYTGDKVTSVQMVGAASIDVAVETDPSFVLSYSTTPSYYWLGSFGGRQYNAYNTGTEGSNGVVEVKKVNEQNVVTEVAGIDSGMATTWTGIPSGGTVGFSFSIGSVAETGARIKATAEVASDSVILTDLDTSAVYRLADEAGNPVTEWLTPDSGGRLVITDLKPDTKYIVQAKPKNASDDKIQNAADLTTAIDPSKLTEAEGKITCTPTASSLTFAGLNHNYAYQLMTKSEENGEEVYTAVTDWQNPEETKGLTFNRLAPDTTYYLVAKSASNTGSAKREYRTNKAELKATATRRAQINLAVGSTSTDYSDFEEKLREQLDGFNPENIAVSALSASTASSTTSFTWNKYDHTNGSTSNTTNKHFINVNELTTQTANDYNSKANHIVETGNVLDFYGYGTSAYKDFYLYANDQTTRKEIEFKVTEGTAYDAFDGAGFLVNSSVSGSYTANTSNAQKLNGYLVFFQYNGSGTGQSIKVFQLTDVNTYYLQQGMMGNFTFDSVSTVGASYSTSYGTIKLIAQSTTSYGNYKYRKVHIKVLPTYIQVWYSGGASNSAQNVDLTANNATRDDYLLKWNVSGVSGVQDKISIDAVFDNGTTFRGGFGPLSSYRAHNCGQLTHFTMSDVNLDMDVVRSMTDIIRQPDWDSNFDSYLVNLNEARVSDFSDTYSTAEIINRLIEDNVSYIGWGSNVNAGDSAAFIDKLNVGGVRGTFINKQAATTSTYQSQIEAIANYIKTNTPEKQALESTIVSDGYNCRNYLYILDEDWQIDGIDTTLIDDGGWTVTRSSTGLDYTDSNGNLIVQPDKTVYATNANLDVDSLFRQRSGYYQIYRTSEYEASGNEAPVYLQVHTNEPPKAGVSTAVSGSKCTVTSNATDDLPGFEDGIMVTKVSNNAAIASNTVSEQEMTGTQSTNTLEFTFERGVIYMIRQVLKDSDGSITTISQMFSVNPDVCMKPYSSFAVNNTELLTRRDTLTITDQSRAADDSLVTSEYVLQDSNGNYYKLNAENALVNNGTTRTVLATLNSQDSINGINLGNLKTGMYTLSMTSKASKAGATASNATEPVSRLLNITKGLVVSWNYNGGSLSGITEESPLYVEENAVIQLPDEEPVKDGCQFIRWSDGTNQYNAGGEVRINHDLTFTAVYKNTFTLIVNNNWQYYYDDSAAGRCYDAAPEDEYPILSVLKLQWRLRGTTEWSDYSGRASDYHIPFVIEETESLEGLEVTGSDNVTPYEYRVCQDESDKRQNYRSDVTGDDGQDYITAGDDSKTITVQNSFAPVIFDVVVQASLSELPEFIKADTENISLKTYLYYYSNRTNTGGNAEGWTKVQQQTEPIVLDKGNSFRNTYGIWKWETEQPGDESKNISYANSGRLDVETSVWGGTEGFPKYLTFVYGEQSYQYGADVQEPIVLTLTLNEEYLSYDGNSNVITINKDFKLKDTLLFNHDITINLNGHTITAPDGKMR